MNGSDLLVVVGGHTPGEDVPGYRRVHEAWEGRLVVSQAVGPAERIDHSRDRDRWDGDSWLWVTGVCTDPRPASTLAAARQRARPDSQPPDVGIAGHFAAVVVTPRRIEVWTDHMGTVPVHWARSADGALVIGTDLWSVARRCGRTQLDPASCREFLGRGSVTSPHTLFRDVRRLPPAARSVVRHASTPAPPTAEHYWTPSPDGAPTDLREAAAAVREATTHVLAPLVGRAARPLVLLSGGEDSRVVAAIARKGPNGDALRGRVFLDRPNRELALARAAAKILRVPLEPRWRPADLYTTEMELRIRAVGPGVDVRHMHSWGLIAPDEGDLWIDGYGSDFMLKAELLPSNPSGPGWWRPDEFAVSPGVLEGLARCSPTVLDGIRQDEEVAERRRVLREQLRSIRDEPEASLWTRYWPVADWSTYGFFAGNWAQARVISPFLTGPVIDAVRGLREADKLNRALFVRAFAPSLGLAGLVPRSGGQVPALAGPVGRGVGHLVGRGFQRAERASPGVPAGPWMPEDVIRNQSVAILDALDPAAIDAVLGHLDGMDGREQVMSHPFGPTRLLQVVTVLAESGGVVSGSEQPRVAMATASVQNERGVVIHVDPADARGQAMIASAGDVNPSSLDLWRHVLGLGAWDLVIDVGANYGEMLLGCPLPGSAEVVAFEASPAVLPFLRRSLAEARSSARLRDVAVLDRSGTTSFLVDRRWSGTSRVGDRADAQSEVVTVRAVTLDEEFPDAGPRRAAIKVDVEGAEMRVLRGATEFLGSLRDYAVMVEVLHLPHGDVAELTRAHALYLWDLRMRRLVRVAPCDQDAITRRLASGAYYPQDAVLRPLRASAAR